MYDFKISHFITGNGRTKATVCVYQGSVTTEDEYTSKGMQPITRYRRSNKVRSFQLDLSGEYPFQNLLNTAKLLLSLQEQQNLVPQQK